MKATILKKINWFWIVYFIALLILFAFFQSCSSSKTLPADFRFKKETVNKHPKANKSVKVKHCNR